MRTLLEFGVFILTLIATGLILIGVVWVVRSSGAPSTAPAIMDEGPGLFSLVGSVAILVGLACLLVAWVIRQALKASAPPHDPPSNTPEDR